MYLPYLRGKQFEMLALRELIPLLRKNQGKISPIIEPVKRNSTFDKSLRDLISNNINFTIVINPQVGDLVNDNGLYTHLSAILNNYTNYQIGIIAANNNIQGVLQEVINNNLTPQGFTIIYNTIDQRHQVHIQNLSNHLPIIYNVVNLNKTIGNPTFIQNFDQQTRIPLADYFVAQSKNSNYLDNPDSTFSNICLQYGNYGYAGFGDFLTVGEPYVDSGASPYAVAIHISYYDNDTISVKHFTSDTNHDQSDPGGKFLEANQKLVEWCDDNGINTLGCNKYRQLHANQHYPGLGTLKKLSIINHIELILSLI